VATKPPSNAPSFVKYSGHNRPDEWDDYRPITSWDGTDFKHATDLVHPNAMNDRTSVLLNPLD